MIALVFITCLETSPDICQERSLLFSEQMTPMRCLMNAQPQLADWAKTHPRWKVASYRCGRPEQFGGKV